MAKTIVWGISGERSWITGERISYDEGTLHHIRHGSDGRTLYGGFYDTLKNLAVVKGNKENNEVEGPDQRLWEDRFVYMWDMFKQGRFREATMHWDPVLQAEFLRDIRSNRYLTYWINKI